jgi:GT2 family glycosyltransferase
MKVAAIVVTYNRFELLKKCIAAIQAQIAPLDTIIVVNNQSTDGSTEWLKEQKGLQVIHQENKGGSWGFYTGIKVAFEQGFDWLWVMDDDTIPHTDSLATLLKNNEDVSKLGVNNVGFIGSKVLWRDGSPHLMNLPDIHTFDFKREAFNTYDAANLYGINSCSFVSVLFSHQAVKSVGLPIKEFFIWADDQEYTQRISRAGFRGFYSSTSAVLHDTPVNYSANIFTDTLSNAWKYRYGIRNELFLYRHSSGWGKFFSKFLKRLLVFPFRILLKRKDSRWAFIKINTSASLSALFFNPKVEKF